MIRRIKFLIIFLIQRVFIGLWTYYINKKKSKYYFYFYSIASLPVNKSNLNDKKKFYSILIHFMNKVFKLEELLFWNKFQRFL